MGHPGRPGEQGGQSFVAFYLNDGLIDAAVAVDRGKDLRRTIPLIKARVPVDLRELRDETVDLRTLVREGAAQGSA